ncbi:hypothetical protein CEB94_29955 [Streptomyces hawaiiensis]|uniref:Uncharacterized protein n=1 Tax=Streptomyces hawaiiensis TaxID=67305 RepID=A0A6G5RKN7_9ACTN|nr:hypothetical protein CEB94_29955 [Streptomyces hawaiiensis]
MIASWRSFSALTAAAYSALLSICLGVGMSATALGSSRVSRGGMALRTEARPVAAAVTWVPAASAKAASLRAWMTRLAPHLRKASPDSPSQSTRVMWPSSSSAASSMAVWAFSRAVPASSRSSGFADSTMSIMAFRAWPSKFVLPKTRGTFQPKGRSWATPVAPLTMSMALTCAAACSFSAWCDSWGFCLSLTSR